MNVVFVPNIDLKNGRSNPYHYSIKSWKHWCDKNNAKLIEWNDPIMDPSVFKITLQRWWVLDILEHNNIDYDQVLMIDADTIVHPNCPNFFNETDNKFSAVLNNGCYEWTNRSIREWKRLFPSEEIVPTWKYVNGGFIIGNKNVKHIYDAIKSFYLQNIDTINTLTKEIKAGTDQTIINYLIQQHKFEVNYLAECYNLQDLFRKSLLHIPNHSWFTDELHFLNNGWVYHFNAIPPNDRNFSYWMERTYKHLYK
jgi:hypothetical protein